MSDVSMKLSYVPLLKLADLKALKETLVKDILEEKKEATVRVEWDVDIGVLRENARLAKNRGNWKTALLAIALIASIVAIPLLIPIVVAFSPVWLAITCYFAVRVGLIVTPLGLVTWAAATFNEGDRHRIMIEIYDLLKSAKI